MTYCCYCTFNQTRSKRDPTNSSFWYEFSQDFFVTFLWFAHRVEEIAPKETKTNCCLRLQIAFQIETRFKLHIFFISQTLRNKECFLLQRSYSWNYRAVLFRRSLILPNILRLLSSFWTNWRQRKRVRVEPVSFTN